MGTAAKKAVRIKNTRKGKMLKNICCLICFFMPLNVLFAQFGDISGPPTSLSECMAVAEIEKVSFRQDQNRDYYNYNVTLRIKEDLTKNLRGKKKVLVAFGGTMRDTMEKIHKLDISKGKRILVAFSKKPRFTFRSFYHIKHEAKVIQMIKDQVKK